jgi:hypothetical protein
MGRSSCHPSASTRPRTAQTSSDANSLTLGSVPARPGDAPGIVTLPGGAGPRGESGSARAEHAGCKDSAIRTVSETP